MLPNRFKQQFFANLEELVSTDSTNMNRRRFDMQNVMQASSDVMVEQK